MFALIALLLAAGTPADRVPLLREVASDVALAQVKKQDEKWNVEQRDCAGLIRFAYRQAYKRIAPERLQTPLFRSAQGPSDFADAETLLGFNFQSLGRDAAAMAKLRSGDVIAFRQPREGGDAFHLMMVVTPADRAHVEAHVVYHPGEAGAKVRVGRLSELTREAPGEWRPIAGNPSFLGVFRFKEWPS